MTVARLWLAVRVERTDPQRTCVGCRVTTDQSDLVRLAVSDGLVQLDPERRLAGRGAYLHADPACLDRALKRRALPRALRTQAEPAPGLRDAVQAHAKAREKR